MFRQPVAEQKLAAILILQEYLIPQKEIDPSRDLDELVMLFQHARPYLRIGTLPIGGSVYEYILGPLIQQDDCTDGDDVTARRIAAWVSNSGTTTWQRRAALVVLCQS
jgi:hypothetical protein